MSSYHIVMVEVVLLGTLMYWEDYGLHVHVDLLMCQYVSVLIC